MKEYKKSNYAINKVRKGIVYKNADGSILEVTFEKIAKDNPQFTKEDFEKLKQFSDELYRQESNADSLQSVYVKSTLDETKETDWLATPSAEDKVIEREEEKRITEKLQEAMDCTLTPTQRKRVLLYFFKGLTYREIAKIEHSSAMSICESVQSATKKMKKYLKNF